MAAIATGTAVEGAGQGFMGLLECLVRALGAAPRRGERRGRRAGLHAAGPLRPRAGARGARLRVPFAELGVPPEAASSFLFPAAMGWQRAARILLTSDWVGADELVELGLALQVCEPGTVLDETVALAARIAAHPRGRHPGHHLAHAGGPARCRPRGQPARAGAFAAVLLGAAASSGALAEFAAKAPPA